MNSETSIATARNCPKCGHSEVRRTHRVGKRDHILSRINIFPYYCLECDARFHRVGRQ